MRWKGFTLVELMVVIAIIVLLIALLLPVLVQVRKRGYGTTCTSNLHQLVSALLMYTEDYGGVYPERQTHLWPYLKTLEILICPADPNPEGGATREAHAVLFLSPNLTKTSYYYFGDGFLTWEIREGDRTFTYAEVLKQVDENHGVFACALHGEPIRTPVRIPKLGVKGLVLRARWDGSVERAQVEYLCLKHPDYPNITADRPDWFLFTNVRPMPEGLMRVLPWYRRGYRVVPCVPPYD